MKSAAKSLLSFALLFLNLNGIVTAFATPSSKGSPPPIEGTPDISSLQEERPYPLGKWANDKGQFSLVKKSKEEQKIDEDFVKSGGFIRNLFRRERRYVFYVKSESKDTHAYMILRKREEKNAEATEDEKGFSLGRIGFNWIRRKKPEDQTYNYKILPNDTKRITVSDDDRFSYLSFLIHKKDHKNKGVYFYTGKNIELDMKRMNYILREKQFEYDDESLVKFNLFDNEVKEYKEQKISDRLFGGILKVVEVATKKMIGILGIWSAETKSNV